MTARYTCYTHPTMGSWGYLRAAGDARGTIVAIDRDGNVNATAFTRPSKLANDLRSALAKGFRAEARPMYLQIYLGGDQPKGRFVSSHPDLSVDKIGLRGCEGVFYATLRPGTDIPRLTRQLRATLASSTQPGSQAMRAAWLVHVGTCSMYVPVVNSGPADILAFGQWARAEQLVVTPFERRTPPPLGMPSVERQTWRQYLMGVWSEEKDINVAFAQLGWPLSELLAAQPAKSTFETEAGGW